MGFLKGFIGLFGKSRTIEFTTRRILRDFTIALTDFVQENPNMPLEQILQNSDFHNRLILQDWKGKEIGGAASIIPKAVDKSKEDPYALLTNIVWSMVRFELSYDRTMGTEKDMKIVADILESYIMEIMENTNQNDQKLSEQGERLKDPDGFTLKERQEWEQLLKEERVQQRGEQGMVSNSKTSEQLSTAKLALAITCTNAIPEKFMEWLNLLLDTYLSQNKKNENTINMLSFELGSARIVLYFLMAQNYYFKLYPYSSKLFDAFSHALQQHLQSIYGDDFQGALSLFKIRLSSYSTAFESNTYEDRFSQLIKLLHFHFNYCLHSSDAFSYKVTPDSDVVKYSLPLGEQLGYCAELINHMAEVTNTTFEMYKIVE